MSLRVRYAADLYASIEAAPSPMALLATDLTHAAVSPAWAALHGDVPERLVGQTYTRLFPAASKAWAEACTAALGGTTAVSALVPVAGRWARFTVHPYGVGEVTGLVVHAHDLTTDAPEAAPAVVTAQQAPSAAFAFDPAGRITGGDGSDGTGARWGGPDLLARPGVTADSVRSALAGTPAAWSVEALGRVYDVSAAPTRSAHGHIDGGIGIAVDVTECVAAARRAAVEADGLRRVVSVISRPGSLETLATALLGELTGFLGLSVGLLARVEGGTYTCVACYAVDGRAMTPGDTMPIGDTYCDLTMSEDAVVAIDHMGASEYVGHRCYAVVGLEAYIGAPVVVAGETFGAISFSSTRPAARRFTEADADLVRLAAEWAGSLIERLRLGDPSLQR